MKILIVEDDLTIQKQLKTLLSGSGYQVEAVADFSKVIEQLKAFGPHLVLLDIKLPGNSGFEICSQIRSFSDIPIVVCHKQQHRYGRAEQHHAGRRRVYHQAL